MGQLMGVSHVAVSHVGAICPDRGRLPHFDPGEFQRSSVEFFAVDLGQKSFVTVMGGPLHRAAHDMAMCVTLQ